MGKYKHTEDVHNLDAPQEIVPVIYELLKPQSVIDIGCGIGTFLKVFKNLGVEKILGIDGKWVDKVLLNKHIDSEEFLEYDLEKEIVLDQRFDLVVSLEVAEHLSESSADIFIENLVNAGEVILFSAAIPMQGGQNHINEQWLAYWELKFSKHNYVILDVIRPLFWNNENVNWWYKQNMVLVVPENYVLPTDLVVNPLQKVVHYDLFIKKSTALYHRNAQIKRIQAGEAGKKFYLKMLFKSIFKN